MSNAPVKKFRIGYVTANVWKNETNDTVFYTVDINRSYKDASGAYKSTTSMNHDDLLNAAKLLQVANEWIMAL